MADYSPIETRYNGYRFRSRLEARWAVFFDAMGITYEYEPEGLKIKDGKYYLPDFYLPQLHCYFEVKRAPKKIMRSCLPREEYSEEIEKIAYGSHSNEWAGIIAFGDPYDHYMWIFCQDVSDSSGGSYNAPVVFGLYPATGKPMLCSWDDCRDRTFLTRFGHGDEIQMETGTAILYYNDSNPYITEKVIAAELKARQARFEHGETPTA